MTDNSGVRMATKTSEQKRSVGKIVQVIGPVIDVEFEPEQLPELYNAVTVKLDSGQLVAEVEQHIGRNHGRAVGISSTDGIVRGMEVIDTGQPITVPVGGAHRDRADLVAADVLFDFGDELARVQLDRDGVVELGQLLRLELDVDDWSNDLHNFANATLLFTGLRCHPDS